MQRHSPIDDILLLSEDIHDRVAKLPKFLCFGAANIWGKGPPKFLMESGSPSNMWQISKFGDDRPSDFGDQTAKKDQDLNYSSKT